MNPMSTCSMTTNLKRNVKKIEIYLIIYENLFSFVLKYDFLPLNFPNMGQKKKRTPNINQENKVYCLISGELNNPRYRPALTCNLGLPRRRLEIRQIEAVYRHI